MYNWSTIIARIANNSQMDTCCAGGKEMKYKLQIG